MPRLESSSSLSGTSTLLVSSPIAGSGRALIVTVSCPSFALGSTRFVSAMDRGGVPLTLIAIRDASGPSAKAHVEIWGLNNPTAGAATLTITLAGTSAASVTAVTSVWTGVDPSTPWADPETYATTGPGAGTTVATSQGDVVIHAKSQGVPSLTFPERAIDSGAYVSMRGADATDASTTVLGNVGTSYTAGAAIALKAAPGTGLTPLLVGATSHVETSATSASVAAPLGIPDGALVVLVAALSPATGSEAIGPPVGFSLVIDQLSPGSLSVQRLVVYTKTAFGEAGTYAVGVSAARNITLACMAFADCNSVNAIAFGSSYFTSLANTNASLLNSFQDDYLLSVAARFAGSASAQELTLPAGWKQLFDAQSAANGQGLEAWGAQLCTTRVGNSWAYVPGSGTVPYSVAWFALCLSTGPTLNPAVVAEIGSASDPDLIAYPFAGGTLGATYRSSAAFIANALVARFSPDGRWVAIGSLTAPYLRIYPWNNGLGDNLVSPSASLGGTVLDIAWSPDGKFIVAIVGGAIKGWVWTGFGFGAQLADPPGTIFGCNSLAFSHDGQALAVLGNASPFIHAWHFSSAGWGAKHANPSAAIVGTFAIPKAISFSPDSAYLAVPMADTLSSVNVYNWSASGGFGAKVTLPSTTPTQARAARWSPDGKAIFIGSGGGLLYAWKWSAGFGAAFTGATVSGIIQDVAVALTNKHAVVAYGTPSAICVYAIDTVAGTISLSQTVSQSVAVGSVTVAPVTGNAVARAQAVEPVEARGRVTATALAPIESRSPAAGAVSRASALLFESARRVSAQAAEPFEFILNSRVSDSGRGVEATMYINHILRRFP